MSKTLELINFLKANGRELAAETILKDQCIIVMVSSSKETESVLAVMGSSENISFASAVLKHKSKESAQAIQDGFNAEDRYNKVKPTS